MTRHNPKNEPLTGSSSSSATPRDRTRMRMKRFVAELIGTAGLVCAVVGSGIMAERLADGNAAVALLANTVATGAALVFLIIALAPISGAHLNPAVSFVAFLDGRLSIKETISYIVFQIAGGALGTCAANIMFQLPAIYVSAKERSGGAQLLAELVATFGLIATVIALTRRPNPLHVIAAAVACYIVAAYWFTSSTSFANPAVTIARTLSDTFAGIRPQDAPGFIAAQFVGASAAFVLFRWLFTEENL